MGRRMALVNDLRRCCVNAPSAASCCDEKKAVASDEHDSRAALKQLGNQLLADGNLRGAVDAYRRALDAAPSPAQEADSSAAATVHANLSLALLRLGEAATAAEAARTSIELRPAWAKAHYRLGMALLHLGDRASTREAVACFRLAGERCANAREHREVALAMDRAMAAGGGCGGGEADGDDHAGNHAGAGATPRLPRRRVEPLTDPLRIPPSERSELRAHLQREGYVVVSECADASQLGMLRRLLWAHLESSTPMVRGRPETWGRGQFPGPAHLGLQTWGGVGQSEVMWRARCLPRVGAAFEAAWGLEGGAPMLTSFDGLALFRPPQVDGSWATRRALEWLHVDQGSTKRGMVGVQGALLLYDQNQHTGGFVCIPRSHQRHEQLVPDVKTVLSPSPRHFSQSISNLLLYSCQHHHSSTPSPLPTPPPAAPPPSPSPPAPPSPFAFTSTTLSSSTPTTPAWTASETRASSAPAREIWSYGIPAPCTPRSLRMPARRFWRMRSVEGGRGSRAHAA